MKELGEEAKRIPPGDAEERRFQHRGHRGATEFTERADPAVVRRGGGTVGYPGLGTHVVVEVVVEVELDVAEGGVGILQAAQEESAFERADDELG
jgi:hypothetical protein